MARLPILWLQHWNWSTALTHTSKVYCLLYGSICVHGFMVHVCGLTVCSYTYCTGSVICQPHSYTRVHKEDRPMNWGDSNIPASHNSLQWLIASQVNQFCQRWMTWHFNQCLSSTSLGSWVTTIQWSFRNVLLPKLNRWVSVHWWIHGIGLRSRKSPIVSCHFH